MNPVLPLAILGGGALLLLASRKKKSEPMGPPYTATSPGQPTGTIPAVGIPGIVGWDGCLRPGAWYQMTVPTNLEHTIPIIFGNQMTARNVGDKTVIDFRHEGAAKCPPFPEGIFVKPLPPPPLIGKAGL